MGFILFFAIIIIVLIILAFNYEEKKVERKKEEILNQNVSVFGKNFKVKDFQSFKVNEEKLNALKHKNRQIEKAHTNYFKYLKKAKELENDKNFEAAILEYEKGLEYAYSEPILKIHNYAHSIHRLIILYGKTKQKQKLKQHLENSIEKHPNFKNAADWKKRLNKLNQNL